MQLTQAGGCCPRASWDGRFVYYSASIGASAIRRVPVEGGEETEVLAEPIVSWSWALSRGSLYFSRYQPRARGQVWTVQVFDLESGQTTELPRKDGPFFHSWLAVSSDEEWIL